VTRRTVGGTPFLVVGTTLRHLGGAADDLQALAHQAVAAGADYLAVVVAAPAAPPADDSELSGILAAPVLAADAAGRPAALDPLHPAVLRILLDAVAGRAAPPLVDLGSERPYAALEVAAEAGCPVVVRVPHAAGPDVVAPVAAASRLVEGALARKLSPERVFLLLPTLNGGPAGPGAGLALLRALRAAWPRPVHLLLDLEALVLPVADDLLRAIYLRLAVEAGLDSARFDPLALDWDPVDGSVTDEGLLAGGRDFLLGLDPAGSAYRAARQGRPARASARASSRRGRRKT
jgi:hypothetical protein